MTSQADNLLDASVQLRAQCSRIQFSAPVAYVYNPLEYAWDPYRKYVCSYGDPPKKVLFLGMNPGPWGMAQVGVPFGEIHRVRNWLGISGKIQKPPTEHEKRPVEGFSCRYSEVSGKRLWGLFAERFGEPADFFGNHFVLNYSPLLFLDESGRNVTPDKLPVAQRRSLFEVCNEHLQAVCGILKVGTVVGIGKVAAEQASEALARRDVGIVRILHPSPANPQANRNWRETVVNELRRKQIW